MRLLYNPVIDWMTGYQEYADDVYQNHWLCAELGSRSSLCNMVFTINASWADFIDGMLESAAGKIWRSSLCLALDHTRESSPGLAGDETLCANERGKFADLKCLEPLPV